MPSIKVGSSQEILLEISQDLQVSFDSSLIGQLIDWAVEVINSRIENDYVKSFRNEKLEKNNFFKNFRIRNKINNIIYNINSINNEIKSSFYEINMLLGIK